MSSAVSLVATIPSAPASSSGQRAPNLDAELKNCRAKLEDWVNCPSAKTPAGQAKIKSLTQQFDDIKQRIAHADTASKARQSAQKAVARQDSAKAGAAPLPSTGPAGTLVAPTGASGAPGGLLDVYA